MNLQQLKRMAMDHWEEWLPEMAAEMRSRNALQVEALKAAKRAQREICSMMRMGATEQEAREVVLPRYILLKPEETMDEEERRMEAEWQAEQRELREMDRKIALEIYGSIDHPWFPQDLIAP